MKKVPRSSDLAITRIQSLCRRYTGHPAGQVMPMMAILFALLFSMSGLVLDGGTLERIAQTQAEPQSRRPVQRAGKPARFAVLIRGAP